MNGSIRTIYWAGPLFTQAERMWNKTCAIFLRELGYVVILPQEEADNHIKPDGKMDFDSLSRDCRNKALESDVVVVVLDGPDTDSGTSLEAGLKIQSGGFTIGVRTDFRKAEDGELNAMFRLLTKTIFYSSLVEPYENFLILLDTELKQLVKME